MAHPVITAVGVWLHVQSRLWNISGTLIASRWMLTAAHCAETAFGDYSSDHYFSVGRNLDNIIDYRYPRLENSSRLWVFSNTLVYDFALGELEVIDRRTPSLSTGYVTNS